MKRMQGPSLPHSSRWFSLAGWAHHEPLGSAGAVHLEVNGERVPTGSLGEVVRLELRLKDGELVTTFV